MSVLKPIGPIELTRVENNTLTKYCEVNKTTPTEIVTQLLKQKIETARANFAAHPPTGKPK